MRIDYPQESELPGLRTLWREAFGDDDAFVDVFFHTAFSPDRCRCVSDGENVIAALYWLDCRCDGRPLAYIYAVATAKRSRGKGICRALMEDTHQLLAQLGYAGCILVPGEKSLFNMYGSMGYTTCASIRQFDCSAAETAVRLQSISAEEYARLRRTMLPQGAVIQEEANLAFLSKLSRFYAGEELLLCAAAEDDRLSCLELLGSAELAPQILTALGCTAGTFRMPGPGRDFAMYHPFSDAEAPSYFAFAFD